MKPIETEYKGYKFRSRLEARWAVFFDYLNVDFRYEFEGFDLDGIWYLPDFFLPEQEYWIEIKPTNPSREEIEKAKRLCLHTRQFVLICVGEPYDENIFAHFSWWPVMNGHGVDVEKIPKDKGEVANFSETHQMGWIYTKDNNLKADIIHLSAPPTKKLVDAYKAARQARF